jgi:Protein of unknown function (DUF3421)
MRTIAISAALSAGLMAGHAMAADQGNWVFPTGTFPATRDAVVGGRASPATFSPIYICRALVNTQGDRYPGAVSSSGCMINVGGIARAFSSYLEVLVPAQKSAFNGNYPANATNKGAHGIGRSGSPGAPLYFCRADLTAQGKGVQLGSLAPGSSGCLIPYGGTAKAEASYDVLVDLSPYKLPLTTAEVPAGGPIPVDASVGGYDRDGATLYYCQAPYNGAVVPGKTRLGFDPTCNIPWVDSEKPVRAPFQVLVPLWTDIAKASFTFPVSDTATKIHVCQAHAPNNLLLPGRYSRSSDPNYCNLTNGSAAYKPFPVLSE